MKDIYLKIFKWDLHSFINLTLMYTSLVFVCLFLMHIDAWADKEHNQLKWC